MAPHKLSALALVLILVSTTLVSVASGSKCADDWALCALDGSCALLQSAVNNSCTGNDTTIIDCSDGCFEAIQNLTSAIYNDSTVVTDATWYDTCECANDEGYFDTGCYLWEYAVCIEEKLDCPVVVDPSTIYVDSNGFDVACCGPASLPCATLGVCVCARPLRLRLRLRDSW